MRRFESRLPRVITLVAALAAVGVLVGCAPETAPVPSTTQSAPPSQPADAVEPTLAPDGSAAENLPLFAHVMNTVAATPSGAEGRAYIDALAAAGFDKAVMQVTNDLTTVGNQAESIQFSVRWGEECLVGQVGPSTPAPTALVLPGLADGRCLIGQTRVIDW